MAEERTREQIICDYCGEVIPRAYLLEHHKLKDKKIRLCEECSRDKRKYAKAWHKKNKEAHNKTNRDYQQKYRESGKQKEALTRFWENTPKSRRYEYVKKYYNKKAALLGISIKDVQRLAREGMLGATTPENVNQRLDYINEKRNTQNPFI